jgi:hypothetical protein
VFEIDLGDPNRFRPLGEPAFAMYPKSTNTYFRIHSAFKKPPEVFARKEAGSYVVTKEKTCKALRVARLQAYCLMTAPHTRSDAANCAIAQSGRNGQERE